MAVRSDGAGLRSPRETASRSGRTESVRAEPVRGESAADVAGVSPGARFAARPISSELAWVGVSGDVDLRNADDLRRFACHHFRRSPRLVLDLADVGFFGTAGLRVFEGLDEHALGSGARWVLVCDRPVARLLRIADPERHVRMHGSLEAAMSSLRRPTM